MTPNDLIALQQLRLEELLLENMRYKTSRAMIRLHLICIGGPLNDNKHGYTREQLQIFHDIENELGED